MVYQDRSEWPEGVKVMMAEAIKNATPSVEESFTAVETQTECLRAPESDTLSEQKRRVEELMRSLA